MSSRGGKKARQKPTSSSSPSSSSTPLSPLTPAVASSTANATSFSNPAAATSLPAVISPELLHPHELDVTYVAPFDDNRSCITRLPWSSALVFVIVLAVYARTAYRTITGGDSGELVITSCNMGTAHPPGYPTFTMIGRLFITLLPWGSPAWRMNMMSSTLGAGAAAFIHATVYRLTHNQFAGILAGIGFALSPTVWLYSIQGEVFGLNNFLVSCMAYLCVRYFQADANERILRAKWQAEQATDGSANGVAFTISDRTSLRLAYLGAFICGIAMTNQHTTVFYVMAIVVFVVVTLAYSGHLSWKSILGLTLCVFSGMSPYAYLVVSAHNKGVDSWGDQRTLAGFLHHFLRREYGTFQLAADQDPTKDPGMASRLAVYTQWLFRESDYIIPILAIAGLIVGLRHAARTVRRTTAALLFGYVLYMVVFHKLANLNLKPLFLGVQARFWQQANLYVYIWAGVGLVAVVDKLCSKKSRKYRQRIIAVIAIVYAIGHCYMHFDAYDQADNKSFEVNGMRMLESFPKNSIVLLNGDLNNNLLKYPQQCEGVRRDLRLVSVQLMTWEWFVPMQKDYYPNVTFPGKRYHPYQPGGFSIRAFLDKNIKRFPDIFLCGPWKEGDDSWKEGYETLPFGLCHRIYKKGTMKQKLLYETLRDGFKGLPLYRQLGPWLPHKYGEETWEHVVYHDSWRGLVFLSSVNSYHSNQNLANIELLELAKHSLDEVFIADGVAELLTTAGILGAHEYRSAGIIYGQYSKVMDDMKRTQESIDAERLMLTCWHQYVLISKTDDVKELAPYVTNRMNPYRGVAVRKEAIPDDLP